jgi:O-methyltransferase
MREPLRRFRRTIYQFLFEGDLYFVVAFVFHSMPNTTLAQRLGIVRRAFAVSVQLDCPHTQREALTYVRTILSLPRDCHGVVVEAGCYKGGSTTKFSLAADLAGRELVVFDSYCGIPPNDEQHGNTIFGQPANFKEGSYCGRLEEVRSNVANFGKIDCCRFVQGWFDETMPKFKEPIAAAYIDVDLASSTRTCLKFLFPLLQPGGALYSQDGHLPLVMDVFRDDSFWENEVGCERPQIVGLGTSKLIKVIKDNRLSEMKNCTKAIARV